MRHACFQNAYFHAELTQNGRRLSVKSIYVPQWCCEKPMFCRRHKGQYWELRLGYITRVFIYGLHICFTADRCGRPLNHCEKADWLDYSTIQEASVAFRVLSELLRECASHFEQVGRWCCGTTGAIGKEYAAISYMTGRRNPCMAHIAVGGDGFG